jgi:hypothetical protein
MAPARATALVRASASMSLLTLTDHAHVYSIRQSLTLTSAPRWNSRIDGSAAARIPQTEQSRFI